MSDTFGALYFQGQQLNLPGGGPQSIGPFAIPASGIQEIVTVKLADSTVTTVVPTTAAGYAYNAQGLVLIPPVGGTVAWVYSAYMVPSDSGLSGSPQYPTVLTFDPANMPTNIYLFSSGTVSIVLQFL